MHRRLSDWALPAIFALISLVIAGDARSHREARLHPMVSALTIAFALRWADFYAANQIENAPYFIGVLYAVNIGAALIAIALLFQESEDVDASVDPQPLRQLAPKDRGSHADSAR